MSGILLDGRTEPECVECDSKNLNPKHSVESGFYFAECEDCGYRPDEPYEWPEDNDYGDASG